MATRLSWVTAERPRHPSTIRQPRLPWPPCHALSSSGRPNYSKLQDCSPELTFQQPCDQAHLLAAIPPPEVLNPRPSLPTLIWYSLLEPHTQPASLLPQEGPKAVELTFLLDEDSGKGSLPPSPPWPAPSSFSSASASTLEAVNYAAFPSLGQLPKQLTVLTVAKHAQSDKVFNCKYCDKEYISLGALKMHIRSHMLPCHLPTCGNTLSKPWLSHGHFRTHTGEKPFSCSHCSHAFADRSTLRTHLQTHSNIKKYQCKTCSSTFSHISLLHKHQESGCRGWPGALTLEAPSTSPVALSTSILPQLQKEGLLHLLPASGSPSELPTLEALVPQDSGAPCSSSLFSVLGALVGSEKGFSVDISSCWEGSLQLRPLAAPA